jgi:3-hydroxyisobutyrate dehydrogenase-like beta-hydroxyacid dehydrogenase
VALTRTPERRAAAESEGFAVVDTPRELAGSAAVVTCVDSVESTERLYLGADGLVASAAPDQIFIDHGTNGPSLAIATNEAARARGAWFVDAPISGGPEGAATRQLTVFAGGAADLIARAAPILSASAARVIHLGAVGRGASGKLINQLLTMGHAVIAAEAIALARECGLELGPLLDSLSTSFGQSRMLERTGDRIRRGDLAGGAAVRLFVKDWSLLRELARDLGVTVPVAAAAGGAIEAAAGRGLGGLDVAALAAPREPVGGS